MPREAASRCSDGGSWISSRLPASSFQFPVSSFRLSAFGFRLSASSFRLPAFSFQLSAFSSTGTLALVAATYLYPDWRAFEAERLAKLVDQKTLVGEVERRRRVREEHECRWRDVGLRGVHDAHFVAPGARRRVRARHPRQPAG